MGVRNQGILNAPFFYPALFVRFADLPDGTVAPD
jgi:hypothetical protein